MVIGVLQVELTIDGATSLKDKRRVVRSVKDRLHQDHQVSVAEVDALDDHDHAVLGIALVSNEVGYVNGVMDRILEKLRRQRDCFVSDHDLQILTGVRPTMEQPPQGADNP